MTQSDSLTGRRGLVAGVANARSLAYGCARAKGLTSPVAGVSDVPPGQRRRRTPIG